MYLEADFQYSSSVSNLRVLLKSVICRNQERIRTYAFLRNYIHRSIKLFTCMVYYIVCIIIIIIGVSEQLLR